MKPFSCVAHIARAPFVGLLILVPLSHLHAQGFDIMEATIDEIHEAFEAGTLTCRDLVQGYLDRIEAYDQRGPAIHAIQTINPQALAEAERLDAAFASSGLTGRLHCIPVTVKDQVEVAGMRTTYGSAVFKDFVPDRDATVVARMKDAGAIILAKSNLGEFAGGFVFYSVKDQGFAVCRNPYAPDRNASSSSCGAGVSMAANFATVAIAEDTGGSTRGPASHTNTVGLRPTTQLISRFGMMPATPTRDTMGPLTRTVRDAAILADVIAGYDPNDPITAYSVGHKPETYTAFLDTNGLQGARIGVIRVPMSSDVDPEASDYAEVQAVVDQAVLDMRALGAQVMDPLAMPENLQDLLVRSGDVLEREAAVNAYLDQLPSAPVSSFREIARSDLLTPARRNGMLGSLNRSIEREELLYLRSLSTRERLRQVILKIMADSNLDALVYPTFSHKPALLPESVLETTLDSRTSGTNRVLSSATGFPALTVPAGFTPDQLPVGIDILGRPFAEALLFKLGYAYEQGTQHRRPPPFTPPLRRR